MYHFSFPLCKPGNIVFFCHHRHLLFIFSLTFCFSQFVLKWHINIGKVAILLSACQPIQGFYGIAKNTIRIAVSMLRYIFFSIYCFVQIQNYIFTNLPYVFFRINYPAFSDRLLFIPLLQLYDNLHPRC